MRAVAERSPRRGQRRHTAAAPISALASETGRPLLRLLVLASITVSFLAASSAPTPLYATYRAAWGFSALTTTVVFGVYAITFLAALLTAGRLSDHIGRRPVLLAGIAGQILALVIFIAAHNVAALLAARSEPVSSLCSTRSRSSAWASPPSQLVSSSRGAEASWRQATSTA